ncbi:MAG TPA: dihydrodipicolinate synthase family protein [Blastocatellia bacterium]|nr:dihydrodipicolinate synthase family protein [Blastocatellia bacterium]
MKNIHLNGILPPLTTPFDDRGDLDSEGLSENVSRYNEAGLAGYVALGSNGEAVHLSADERMKVVETIRRAAAPNMTLVVGINESSARAAIEASKAAAGLGADALLVITPYFYKSLMTQETLLRYFTEVADSVPVPVLVYNVPQNTGVVIDPATIAALGEHERIIGVKDSAGNMGAISNTIRLTPSGFAVMTGNGGILYPSLMMGATGAILAVACAAPRACVDLYDATRSGDHARARELQNRLAPLSHIVTAGLGVPGLKAALEMAGLVGGAPRSPLTPLAPEGREKVRAIMRQTGLFPGME